MRTLNAQIYVKTRDIFLAYAPGDEVALVTEPAGAPLLLTFSGQTSMDISEQVFEVGNHARADINGVTWPKDVRAISVGDVVHITSPDNPADPGRWVAVASRGFTGIAAPVNVRPIAGSGATSRPAEPISAEAAH